MLNNDIYDPAVMPIAEFEPSQNYFPFWRIPLKFENLTQVKQYAKYLTGEIPLIARQKAENQFMIYVPAFKVADLKSLSQKAVSLTCMQPVLSFDNKSIRPSAEMILPASEALEMGRFIWNAIRFKYRQIAGEKFEIKNGNLGQPELIWITLSMPAPISRSKPENAIKSNANL
jgi:hypothetical protein